MKVEFEDALWSKVIKYAETAGYSSAEEFVQHTVERQIDKASPRKTAGVRPRRSRGSVISTPEVTF
jgi:hypothetical protein